MTEIDITQIRAILGNLPSRYRDLDNTIAAGSRSGASERVSTSRVEAPLVINDAAVDIRSDIVDTLLGWAENLIDELPGGWRPVSKSPAFTAGLLLTFWPRVITRSWFPDMADELTDLANRADQLLDPPERRKVADRINDGLIDGKDVAVALGVSASLVRSWVAGGELTVKERGANGRNLYAIDDIRQLKIRRSIHVGDVQMAA